MTREQYDAIATKLGEWRNAQRLIRELARLHSETCQTQAALSRTKASLGHFFDNEVDPQVVKLEKQLAKARASLPKSKCPYCPTLTPGGFACESCKQDYRDDPDSFK
jgi:hypothetical protein